MYYQDLRKFPSLGFLATCAGIAVVGWILLRDGQRDITTSEIEKLQS